VKIDARSTARTLEQAGNWRALLLYGEDAGLIRERAAAVVRLVAGSVEDPFRVVMLERDGHERLEEEASALSLIGGRRAIWVREGGDGLVPLLKRVLALDVDAIVVIEAAGLASRSKLRVLADAEKAVASIGCYPEEGRALQGSVTAMLAEAGVQIERDALGWLLGRLSSDRAMVRGEIEKLALYAGEGNRLTLEDVTEIVADAGAASAEDAISAALAGDRGRADLALERALADGVNPVAIARSVLSSLLRLRRVAAGMAEGQSRQEAIRALRPPLFFKRAPDFEKALDRWPLPVLGRAAERTQDFERACKQTGAPDLALCRRHIAMLAVGPRAVS